MNYKDHFLFVAQCLTIKYEAQNKRIILEKLNRNLVDWDEVVKISTTHYVFPALYLNLKVEGLLKFVPQELKTYMEYITALNLDRNLALLKQAKEIRNLLLEKNINPVFIKGTGNLLEGLYPNISERMVGDIDFIVPKESYHSTIKLLKKNGYTKVHDGSQDLPQSKHYPRLKKENKIAAVEVHRVFTSEKYSKYFNYVTTQSGIQRINNSCVLSYQDQLRLSIIAYHLNDNGKNYRSISLRTAYDLFLLSKKVDSITILKDCSPLKEDFNNFLAFCALVMNNPASIKYQSNKATINYLKKCDLFLNNSEKYSHHHKVTQRKLRWHSRFNTLKKAIYLDEHRAWLFTRICDKNWQNARMIEFGLLPKSSL